MDERPNDEKNNWQDFSLLTKRYICPDSKFLILSLSLSLSLSLLPEAPCVSSHTEELWYNETVCLRTTIYIYIYIYDTAENHPTF